MGYWRGLGEQLKLNYPINSISTVKPGFLVPLPWALIFQPAGPELNNVGQAGILYFTDYESWGAALTSIMTPLALHACVHD